MFSLGLSRDFLYKKVCETSKKYEPLLDNRLITAFSYLILIMGVILVFTSTFKVGIIGTFNGDAYGFLMPELITSFPYNILSSPMYFGGTLNFLYCAVLNRSITGIVLTSLAGVAYYIGSIYEE